MNVKKYVAHVAFETPLVVPMNGDTPDISHIEAALKAFGATDIKIHLTKYTGAGEHEFVESKDLGLNRVICVKCLRPKNKVENEPCPGIDE